MGKYLILPTCAMSAVSARLSAVSAGQSPLSFQFNNLLDDNCGLPEYRPWRGSGNIAVARPQ
jgi:hypothetical protein